MQVILVEVFPYQDSLLTILIIDAIANVEQAFSRLLIPLTIVSVIVIILIIMIFVRIATRAR